MHGNHEIFIARCASNERGECCGVKHSHVHFKVRFKVRGINLARLRYCVSKTIVINFADIYISIILSCENYCLIRLFDENERKLYSLNCVLFSLFIYI